jgi:hypothetical protein
VEQAVIVHLRLSDDHFGSSGERQTLYVLQGEMAKAIEQADAGEFDGDEFGEGECVLYMYGPKADRLFAAIEPVLKSSPFASGGYAIKRYGDVGDLAAPQVRVTW